MRRLKQNFKGSPTRLNSRRFKNKIKADEVLDVMRSHASTLRPVSKCLPVLKARSDWSINRSMGLVEHYFGNQSKANLINH